MPNGTSSRRKHVRNAKYAALQVGSRVPHGRRNNLRRDRKKALRRRATQFARLELSTFANTTALPPQNPNSAPPTAPAIERADDLLNRLDVKLRQNEASLSKSTAPLTTSQAAIYRAEDSLNHLSPDLQANYNQYIRTSTCVSPAPYTLPSLPYQAPSHFSPSTIHLTTYLPLSSSPSPKHHHHLLTNPIHPLFSPSNFPTLSTAHHALIHPALLLASRFLTSPLTFAWWLPLLHTSPATNPPLPHPNKVPGATYLAPVADTLENRVAAYIRLKRHAKDVTFRFRDEGGRAWASTHHLCGSEKKVVFLDTRFEAFIADELAAADDGGANYNDDKSRMRREAQCLRFQFLLAVNLVHEVAHTLSSTHPEPYHSLSASQAAHTNELGSAWEANVFAGGKIQAVGFDVGCRWGLIWYPWLEAEEEEEEKWGGGKEGRGRFWGVEMRWVKGMFEEEVWGVMEREGGRGKGLGVRVVEEGVREPFCFLGGERERCGW